jgi:uncharacterized protein (DUF952 family)
LTLLHLIGEADWATAQAAGVYAPPSLRTEGFVHFSRPDQVEATADRFYAGRADLLLLEVDPTGLDLRWEEGEPGEDFPHVYEPIPLTAVVAATPFRR